MARVLDPTKVNIRCANCGQMCAWCKECEAFKCKRCKNTFTLEKGQVKAKGVDDCGCDKKSELSKANKQKVTK